MPHDMIDTPAGIQSCVPRTRAFGGLHHNRGKNGRSTRRGSRLRRHLGDHITDTGVDRNELQRREEALAKKK